MAPINHAKLNAQTSSLLDAIILPTKIPKPTIKYATTSAGLFSFKSTTVSNAATILILLCPHRNPTIHTSAIPRIGFHVGKPASQFRNC